ncbi:ribonuclease H-like domain-containing protein [Xylaria arbuscula]|nr:ribonuclease H-like domain-containing protein [Xylaria arbuscula]
MVYIMEFYVGGGSRGNGKPWAVGAAACVLKTRFGSSILKTAPLSHRVEAPTNQRAEIAAIIIALEWALQRHGELIEPRPQLDVRIHSDSRYAMGCMTEWIYKWARNGWVNAAGCQVANRDLIERASNRDDDVKDVGSVQYIWIPREQNQEADEACNDKLEELQN